VNDGLVELEHRVSHMAVTDHDVDRTVSGVTRQNVAALDVAQVPDPGGGPQESVSLLHHGSPLLVLLADVEKADSRIVPLLHVPHVGTAQVGEVDQLPRGAVNIGTRIEQENGAIRRGKKGSDRRAIDAIMEPQQHGGTRKQCPGVPGRHKGVRAALSLHLEADGQAGLRLAPHRSQRLFAHADDVGGLMNFDAGTIHTGMAGQLRLQDLCRPDELNEKTRRQVPEGTEGALDLHPGCTVSPHRVERDADHGQLSSTSRRLMPP